MTGWVSEGVTENAGLASGFFGDAELELWRNVWKDADAKVIDATGTVSFSGSGFVWSTNGQYGVKLATTKGETLTLTLDSTAGWDKATRRTAGRSRSRPMRRPRRSR